MLRELPLHLLYIIPLLIAEEQNKEKNNERAANPKRLPS
jgi:hypothetical protein